MTGAAHKMGFRNGNHLITEQEAVEAVASGNGPLIYTNSENAIGWIAQHLAFTELPDKIGLFKDKARFREMLKPMFPDFYFRKVALADLARIDLDTLPMPCFVKPAVGFFSMGVFMAVTPSQWPEIVQGVHSEIQRAEELYPKEVLDGAEFIIEQAVEGDEYAIDVYFDANGKPVILNILHHLFSSDLDVGDRMYITSKQIIETYLNEFTDFLAKIGRLSGVRGFPAHVEIRRRADGLVTPIEINPMRFGGWCTTADLAHAAYGFNPYLYYFSQKRPNWNRILQDMDESLYSVIVLDNVTGVDASRIETFDYEALASTLQHPLELRKIDYAQYPVFGFLFAKTQADRFYELDYLLQSDLREFIKVR